MMQLKSKKDLIKVEPAADKPIESSPKKGSKALRFGLWLFAGFLGGTVIFTIFVLPNLLDCSNKAKQAEGRQTVGMLNRAQQAYFAQKNAFSQSFAALEIGIKPETTNYQYLTRATATAAFNYALSRSGKNNVKSYVGAVFVIPMQGSDSKPAENQQTTFAILCEAQSPGKGKPAEPVYQNGVITCGSGTKPLL